MEFLLLGAGILLFISRWIRTQKVTNQNFDLLSKAKKDLHVLNELADNIEVTYLSFDSNGFNPELVAANMKGTKVLKGFDVMDVLPGTNRLLIFVESNFEDWDTQISGNTGKVKKSRADFFSVKPDAEGKRIFICGPMFNDNTEKFVFEKFAGHIKKRIIST